MGYSYGRGILIRFLDFFNTMSEKTLGCVGFVIIFIAILLILIRIPYMIHCASMNVVDMP